MINRFRTDEERYARREARIARWNRPLSGGIDRIRAWSSMLFVDHGILRLAYLNLHKVSDAMWRAAQPAPFQIAWLARRSGLKTIINLRGGREHGSWMLEKEAADRGSIALVDFVVRSRGAPDRAALLEAPAFFAGLDYPALMHCKSGADRAGFAAAIYLLVHEKRPLDEAMAQLAPRFGHFRWSKTGILDAFFEQYRDEGLSRGVGFIDWIRDGYDPERLERDFKSGFWSDVIVDRVLRRE